MSLLCRLGRHQPRGIPRWNDGYYFATCKRCGSDLVRTAFERWHVPSGYRVVWSDRPPASRPEVALVPSESGSGRDSRRSEPAHGPGAVPEGAGPIPDLPSVPVTPAPPTEELPAAPAPPPEAAPADAPVPAEASVPPADAPGGKLPIQEVLAQLRADDAAGRTRESAPALAEPPARRRRPAWDFMEDDPLPMDPAGDREPAGGAPAQAPAPDPPVHVDREKEAEPSARRSRRVGGLWPGIRAALRNFWSGPAEPDPVLVIGLALALAAAAALALVIPSSEQTAPSPVASSNSAAGMEEESDPFAASDPGLAAPDAGRARPQEAGQAAEPRGDRAYVAASLLSCRSAPALQASRVRNLARGQEVRVLGIEGDWASLAYRGGQCWARARFISPVPPL
jgi:hypothetical protein